MDSRDLQAPKGTVVHLGRLDHRVHQDHRVHRVIKEHQELQAQMVNQVLKGQQDLQDLKVHKVVLAPLVWLDPSDRLVHRDLEEIQVHQEMQGNLDHLVHLEVRVLEAILVLKVSKDHKVQKETQALKDHEEPLEIQAIQVLEEMLELQGL